MHQFVGTGAAQNISTAKLPVLPKTLKKSIKQFTNLWYFWESIYECAEFVVRRCSKEKVQSWTKHIETFQVLA